MTEKPFCQACENNQEPIAGILKIYCQQGGQLLEIGSGTGQHAAYMTEHFPKLLWQSSDRIEHQDGIRAWMASTDNENFLPPIELDVNSPPANLGKYDYVFSANTAHIMAWEEVGLMFSLASRTLSPSGLFLLYGPFNYGGMYTSEGNQRFDAHLKNFAPHMGIRDFEKVDDLARQTGLSLIDDHEMPANNRLLVWQCSSK